MKQIQLKILLLTSISITSAYICASSNGYSSSTSSANMVAAKPRSGLPDPVESLAQYLERLQAIVHHGKAVLAASKSPRTDYGEEGEDNRGRFADYCHEVVTSSGERLEKTFGTSYTTNYSDTIDVAELAKTMKTSVPTSLRTNAPSPLKLSYVTWAKQTATSLSLNNPLVGVATSLGISAIERTRLLPSKLTSFFGFLARAQVYVSGYHQLKQLHTIATINNPWLPDCEAYAMAKTREKMMHGMAVGQGVAVRLTQQRKTNV